MGGYYLIGQGGGGGAIADDPFGPKFFKTHCIDWVREVCVLEGETTTLELMLTNGERIDVSNLIELQPDLLVLDAFDPSDRTCKHTTRMFLRYGTIYRVAINRQTKADRPIGFSVISDPKVTSRVTKDDGESKAAASAE